MIKKGIKVKVLTGRDKKKEGGIISKESFIHISNLIAVEGKTKNKKTEAKKWPQD